MARMVNPPREFLLPKPLNSCASQSFNPCLFNHRFYDPNLIAPRLRGPFSVALASLYRSFVLVSRVPDVMQRLMGQRVWLQQQCWRPTQQPPRNHQATTVFPQPKHRRQGQVGVFGQVGLAMRVPKRDAQEMQVQKLQEIQIHDVQQVQKVRKVQEGQVVQDDLVLFGVSKKQDPPNTPHSPFVGGMVFYFFFVSDLF